MSGEVFMPKPPTRSGFAWAYVTDDGPLAIRMDGFTDPLDIVPDTLVSGLTIGDKVRVEFAGRYAVIHGKAS